MRVLLTNDDSHRSPLLAFIIENIKKFAELKIVVPKHEQSWKGKSMTRYGYLHMEEIELYGEKAYTVDGTPADCVNIGIYHLYNDSKPDLIISGINAGINAGLGFIWSSGTLGACFEANISGIPAIAFSQHFDSATRDEYIASYIISESTTSKLKIQTDRILSALFEVFFKKTQILLSRPITWNINFPFNLNDEMKFKVCSSGQSFYGSCYKKSSLAAGDLPPGHSIRFEHELLDVYLDKSDLSDNNSLFKGHVSITPIDITTFAQIDKQDRESLQKHFI